MRLRAGAIAAGGACVARAPDGRVTFVRHALPGELVRASVTGESRRFLRADAVEVLEPSPDRVPAPCAFAGPGRCGGCDFQHMALPAQRAAKAGLLRAQLQHHTGLDVPVTVEVPMVHGRIDDDGLGWRTRMQFAVDTSGRAGLRRHRSHEVEPIDDCRIAAPPVAARELLATRWPGAGAVVVACADGGPDPGTGDDAGAGAGAAGAGATRSVVALPHGRTSGAPQPGIGSTATLTAHVLGRRFRISPGSFWQVHQGAPQVLAEAVVTGLQPMAGENVLDLYAGVGLFAAVIGVMVGPSGTVTAVESSRGAAADARYNLRGLARSTVLRSSVAPGVLRRVGPADLVVLDPPRAGAGRAVTAAIAALRPRRVAYVACDPATLGRDLGVLVELGWQIRSLRAFDLFPMTEHVEAVAICEPPGS